MPFVTHALVSIVTVVIGFACVRYQAHLHRLSMAFNLHRVRLVQRQEVNREIIRVHQDKVLEPAQASDPIYGVITQGLLLVLIIVPWLSASPSAFMALGVMSVIAAFASVCIALYVRYDFHKADDERRSDDAMRVSPGAFAHH